MQTRAMRISLLILAYALIAIALTWPLAAHLNRGVTSAVDPVDSIWRIGWGQYQLLHHPLHLFNGNTFYPFPDSYLFDELVLGAAVLTLPLAVVGLAPLAIYNLGVLLSLLLSALAMYALARRFSAVRVAAFIAGTIYAFAPMHLDRIGHIGLLSAQWFPLILLFLDRVVERPRWRDTTALTVCLVMQVISSQYYAIYLLLLVPLFIVVVLVRRPAMRRRAVWGHLLLAGAIAAATVAPLVVGYRRVQTDYAVERTYGQTTYYAATITNYLTADGQNLLWGRFTAPFRAQGSYTFERNMFPGLLALAFAGIGLWVGRRHAWEQFLAALVVISGILALGPELRLTPEAKSLLFRHLPYGVLYWHLPGFDSMRVPARFGTLFLLGIAGLAATGAGALLRHLAVARIPRVRSPHLMPVAASALLLVGFGAEYANHPLRLLPLESGAAIPPEYRWLREQPDARVIELPLVIPDHDREQSIAVREQYFSLAHHHPLVNGNANVLPKGYKALVLEMKHFPSERAVSILQGLSITHVVVHYDQMNAAGQATVRERFTRGLDSLTPAAQFGDTSVYTVGRSAHLDTLPGLIPPGATIRLSRADPLGTGAYMGMLGYVLRDHPLYARLRVDFGEHYVGEPDETIRYDYGIFYPQEDPTREGFPGAELIWQDSVVRVYRQRPA